MSRFNPPAVGTKTTNLAGGVAYWQAPELELASLLLTSMVKDEAYRTDAQALARLRELVARCDKKFVAQAAVYTRHEYGMRSITHAVASELARYIGGTDWARHFYHAVVRRADDITEILAYHAAVNGKLPNAMKRGLAQAFGKFSPYQLAKYRGEGKGFKLVDAANLLHPKPTETNGEALAQLMRGQLKSFDTWENQLSAAGQQAGSEDEKQAFKKEVWVELVRSGKLGYFALLRNLRNILEQAPEVLGEALRLLTDDRLIKKSLVLPFRFITAFDEIQKTNQGADTRAVLMALNRAVDSSLQNVPKFAGRTLVVLDVSGSMQGQPAIIGSLFAAVLVKSNNADLMTFSNDAQYVNVNPMDSTITIANSIRFAAGGTNFAAIFARAAHQYDRVVLLSDMQGWLVPNGYQSSSPIPTYNGYCTATGANPFIYSFDLKGYGSMQFPSERVMCVAGFSEKVLTLLPLLEQDRNALVNTIKQVVF